MDTGYQEIYSVGVSEKLTEAIRRDARLAKLDQDPRVRVTSLTDLRV